MGGNAQHHRGAHAGRLVRRADEPVAALSEPELPVLDTWRVLSAGRRLRFPRSTAGRARLDPLETVARARAPAACRFAAVRRRRRAALVARTRRQGTAIALLRRS